jgi:hypothetical protein
MIIWISGAVALLAGPIYYLFFHDVMNRIQYFERLGVYWVTRNVPAPPGTPFVVRAFMRQTHAPYWRGEGLQFRFRKHTFQIGRLQHKVDSLEAQISRLGWLTTDTGTLRHWGQDEVSA